MNQNTSNKSGGDSRHGKVPQGWTKQSFQIPDKMAKDFRMLGANMGHGGVKALGTAAIAFILSLEESQHRILCDYVRQKTWSDPVGLKSENMKKLIMMLLGDHDAGTPIIEPIWYVDKIVDPELSQPPGKKLSDEKKNKRKDDTA